MGIRNLVQNQLIVRFSTLYALITLRKNMQIQLFRKLDLEMISIYSKKINSKIISIHSNK